MVMNSSMELSNINQCTLLDTLYSLRNLEKTSLALDVMTHFANIYVVFVYQGYFPYYKISFPYLFLVGLK